MKTLLDGFLEPASIAVVGASDDTAKPGGKILANLTACGYGGDLLLVNPRSGWVQGRPAVSAIDDLPVAPDLVYIAIPARLVAAALEDLGKLGARRVVVLSAGFGEVDERGRIEELRLAEIADRHGMVLLGPNCLGVMSPVHAGKFAGILPEMRPGGIDFISGSGATVDMLAEQGVRRGLHFHTFFTVGNSAQTGVADVLALYDQAYGPDSAKHIMLYVEKVDSPAKLLRHARSLTQKGCILLAVKAGVTQAGKRAAASHTGAMSAADTAVQALFDKAGIIRLNSKLEMVDVATALTLSKGQTAGRRACMVTDAGGPGVMAADELNRQNIALPRLKKRTRRRLTELLPPGAGVNNPVDMLPTRTPEQVARTLAIIAEEEADAVDYILVQFGAPGFADNWPVYEAVIEAMDGSPLPVFPSFSAPVSSAAALRRYRAAGKCHFEDEVSMARAIGCMVNRLRTTEPGPDPSGYDGKAAVRLLKNVCGVVPPALARQVLGAAGIPMPEERRARTRQDLAGRLTELAPPWVMKVVGPLHKSDVGGVATAVSPAAAGEIFDRLMRIEGARGVVIQETVDGPEVIMGLSREGDFGHLAAFGLGGVLAEALQDVTFGLAPLSKPEALRIVCTIRGLPVLEGWRGQPGMDLDCAADLLVRVSLLARDIPQIKELDINPVKGTGKDLFAVDVRIIVSA